MEQLPAEPEKSRWELDQELRAVRLGYIPKEMLQGCLRYMYDIVEGRIKASARTRAKCTEAIMAWASKQEDVQVALMALRRKDDEIEARQQDRVVKGQELETRKLEIAAKLEGIRSGQPQIMVNVGPDTQIDYQDAVAKIVAKSGLGGPNGQS